MVASWAVLHVLVSAFVARTLEVGVPMLGVLFVFVLTVAVYCRSWRR
jgi:hypothetical protein